MDCSAFGWSECIDEINARAQDDTFFDMSLHPAPSVTAEGIFDVEEVHGDYPVFFDINFHEDRSRKLLQIMREGFYLEQTRSKNVKVEFLLYVSRSILLGQGTVEAYSGILGQCNDCVSLA